jgi:RNA polymerase sigma-70 factor (ECF subfamily)
MSEAKCRRRQRPTELDSGVRHRPSLELVTEDDPADLAALLHRSAGADEPAFAALYDATAPQVYGLAVRVLGSPDAAQQVTCEAYLEVWRTARRYDSNQGSAMGWIVAIAHRRFVDRVRSQPLAVTSSDQGPPTHRRRSRGGALPCSVESRRVQDALSGLDPDAREIVKLAYFDGRRSTQPEELTAILWTLAAARSSVAPGE